jgi:Trk K+ transport system NAD-binding subunit
MLLLRQNARVLEFVIGWFVINLALFAWYLHRGWREAALITFYFKTGTGMWAAFYQAFSGFVVFGLIMSVIVTNLNRKYRPEETCRVLASESRGHVVVIGYSHLGQRICEWLWRNGDVPVVVEHDRALVDPLVREEHPLVLGSGHDPDDLRAAGVARARLVVIAADGVETAAIAGRRVREINPECDLLLRCADDDVGEVLGKAYRARVVSTSRMVASFIAALAQKHKNRAFVVIGYNTIGRRLVGPFKSAKTTVAVIEPDAAAVDGLTGVDPIVVGSPTEPAVLQRAGIRDADFVVLTGDELGKNLVIVERIRDANPDCRIVCRGFQDDATSVLAQRPFNCTVVSSSRHAAETLVREGVFARRDRAQGS